MDIQKAFVFQFDDREWISKLGIGAVFAFIPILNFAWTGYMVQLLRNVMEGIHDPLPSWDDIGGKFSEGLVLFGAWLVYSLPLIFVICLPLGVLAASGALSANNDLQEIAEMLAGIGGILFSCLMVIMLLYFLVLSVLYPAIMVIYSRNGSFESCFRLGEAFRLVQQQPGAFFTAWAANLLAGMVVGFGAAAIGMVASFVPCLGSLFSILLTWFITVYLNTAYAHLFGQFASLVYGSGNAVVQVPD